jgi:hypothetical protein
MKRNQTRDNSLATSNFLHLVDSLGKSFDGRHHGRDVDSLRVPEEIIHDISFIIHHQGHYKDCRDMFSGVRASGVAPKRNYQAKRTMSQAS